MWQARQPLQGGNAFRNPAMYGDAPIVSSRTRTAVRRFTFPASLLATVVFAMALAASAPAAGGAGGMATHCGTSGDAPEQMTMHGMRTSVLCLINRVRLHYHLQPLSYNRDLRVSATHHSRDMVRHRYFAHSGSRGSTTTQRVVESGYLHRTEGFYVGENIGGGIGRRYGSPLGVLREWMHSPPHRENLLSPRFRDAGVGVWRGFPDHGGPDGATYTLDLGARD